MNLHDLPAITANGRIPVSTGFTWAAGAQWATFAAVSGFIATIVRAIGVQRLAELFINRGKTIRDEKRVDDASNAARLTALEGRMERTGAALVFCIGALTTAIDGLESDDRRVREVAAGRARESIALAASTLGNEDPYSKALARLAAIAPVDRSAKA